tara:strand:+ start:5257 stop:6192 length:936 start_codon:yes stop_codon:yes gene_type:complete
MPKQLVDDETFIQMFSQLGASQMANHLNTNESSIFKRRRRLEEKYDRPIHAPSKSPTDFHPERREFEIKNGNIFVASDAHYWPDEISTAHRAFIKVIKEMKPKAVVLNGDVLDGATISRHPSIQWEDSPTVADELEACEIRLDEIQKAAKKAKLFWTLGNHDARFESRLATVAQEFVNVKGVRLKDHFPKWLGSWSLLVNNSVMIKHRFKGGIHATHNNTVTSGMSMVTGHLHSLKVTPWADYHGTRWGVDTGTLADTHGPQFRNYMEDNPRNWRSGFAILTFENGELRWPELVHVTQPGCYEFRGKTFSV